MTTPDVLEAAKPWMQQCGPHDFGVQAGSCGCPPVGDPRPIVSKLAGEIEKLQERLDAARALAAAARASIGIGCLSSVEGDDGMPVCDGNCGGHRTTGWTLDPAAVLHALDGEQS